MRRMLHNLNERFNTRFGPFLRRLLLTIGLGALIVAVTVFFILPQVVITLAESVLNAELIGVLLRLLIVLAVDGLLGYLIYRQWQHEPVKGLLVRAPGVTSELDTGTVERQIVASLARVAEVGEVRAEVQAVNGNADITLHVETQAGAVLPQKQKEINRALLDVVERQLGLRLAGPPRLLFNLSDTVQPMAVEAPLVAEPATMPAEAAPEPAAALDARDDPGMAWMFMDEEDSTDAAGDLTPDDDTFLAEPVAAEPEPVEAEAVPEAPVDLADEEEEPDVAEFAAPNPASAASGAGLQRLSREELAKLVAEGRPILHGDGDGADDADADDADTDAEDDDILDERGLLLDNEDDGTLHFR